MKNCKIEYFVWDKHIREHIMKTSGAHIMQSAVHSTVMEYLALGFELHLLCEALRWRRVPPRDWELETECLD